MDAPLSLDNIRNVLTRLEETIIFGLIERAQFCRNEIIYRPGAFGDVLPDESLVGFLLHETERIHARMRRYTSPDEHPFYSSLPPPMLPALAYADNPLRPNTVNINAKIRAVYEQEMIPFICPPGDDKQYGSSSVNDVALLPALSKRIHYGKFVAESKYRATPSAFDPLIRAGDEEGLVAAVTDEVVEGQVLERVRLKAGTYGQLLKSNTPEFPIAPGTVEKIYSCWIIPLNKEVQAAYLLQRNLCSCS